MSDDFDPRTVTWVFTEDDLTHLLGAIERAEAVVMDLETTGLDEWAAGEPYKNGGVPARIVLASLTLPRGEGELVPTTWVVPLSHPESVWQGRWRQVMTTIAQMIVDNQKPVDNHNIKFDSKWVWAHTGVDLSPVIRWDTRVSSHLLDENASTRLKERAPATFGVQRWDDFDLTIPGAAECVPLLDLGMYAARDTYWTWRLAEYHRDLMFINTAEQPISTEDIENARLGKLALWCSMPTLATLTEIEQTGMTLDRVWANNELFKNRERAAQLGKGLASKVPVTREGPPSWAPTSHWFKEWADGAVELKLLRVAALTPSGVPQWNKSVLIRQARRGGIVAGDLLELRGCIKRAEYLSSWISHVTKYGKIHTTYNSGSVVTGRLSSNSPNMQQVTAILKAAFPARPGYVFADLDYSQIELRAAAHISQCQPMIKAFKRGDDLHRLLAAAITGKNPGDVTPEERQAGKSANFGLLYGMSAYGFREYAETVYDISFTMKEAVKIHATFFSQWKGMAEWHIRAAARAHSTNQVVSPIGRIRRLPLINNSNEGMTTWAERSAINSPVQGFASDLMQMAAASISGKLPGSTRVAGVTLIGTVHDSILVEVLDDENKISRIHECMERMTHMGPLLAKLDCALTVPLAVEAKIGPRWGMAMQTIQSA